MPYATINKPSLQFNTVTYAGANGTQSVTGTGFQPDLVWIKNRSITADHMLYDVVRGTGATKALTSDNQDPEGLGTNVGLPSQYGYLSAFGSDGFTVVAGSSNGNFVNTSGNNFASWNWKANGAGVSNTAGTISSTVSANTTAGFSIVSWTGTGANGTVGHGLGVAPKMIIVKGRSTVYDWVVWQTSLAATDFIVLNKTDAKGTAAAVWNSTTPTSSVFSLGSNVAVNQSGATQIAYCFAEVKGFSKFGSYVANGSLDNAFVYTGFKPAMVIIKRSDGANSWTIFDNKRDPYNEVVTHMAPNNTIADDTNNTYNDLDFLSNGFKVREDNDEVGASGGNYIYIAFAEQPLVGTNNVPATAR